ncbi:MAG: hypothetical protein ACLTCB_03560, partial [Merdibacter sp.]
EERLDEIIRDLEDAKVMILPYAQGRRSPDSRISWIIQTRLPATWPSSRHIITAASPGSNRKCMMRGMP